MFRTLLGSLGSIANQPQLLLVLHQQHPPSQHKQCMQEYNKPVKVPSQMLVEVSHL
jgi:hypothetical protein